MYIGISGTPLLGPLAGVGRYTYEPVEALAREALADSFELVANAFRRGRERFGAMALPQAGNVRARLVRIPAPVLFLAWRAGVLRLPEFDVFHSTNHVLPALQQRTRLVATVHDLSVFDHGEWYTNAESSFFRRELARLVRRADRLIAASSFTRGRLVERFGVDPGRVVTIYQGCSVKGTSDAAEPPVTRPYFLYVGTIEPRKNVQALIRAYDRLRQRRPGLDPQLVLVGRWGWLYDEARSAYEGSPFRRDILSLDYLEAERVAAYYRHAVALVYPSLYEGFGRPPLEAMACGCPVVATSAASLPEVVGDAGLLVPPGDEEALSAAMERVLTDTELRRTLVERGRKQAEAFSWGEAARQTLAVYRAAVGGEGQG